MPVPMKPNREYDPFASVYNRYWGKDYRAKAFPVLRRLLLDRISPGSSVLDVGCGTGQIAAEVSRLGFQVTGIDSSEGMLRYARENAPAAEFHWADVRDFSIGRQFDGVYSVFESLNHVPTIRDLTRAFRQVRKHLKPGGVFLFDLNNDDAFALYWNAIDASVKRDASLILRMNYDSKRRLGTGRFTVFEKRDRVWERQDFTIHQTCHESGAVCDALRRAGFEDVGLYSAFDAGIRGAAAFGREFYLVR